MWLLETSTLRLTEFFGVKIPPYAILSHTWRDEEISFFEKHEEHSHLQHKAGFKKIEHFCRIAKTYGFDHAWVDTCCIDKRSSAELSEAINSMYNWYADAAICLVYLHDVPSFSQLGRDDSHEQIEAFKVSRWFTRGWTLQELIASSQRLFFASDWSIITDQVRSEHRSLDLMELVSTITHIDSRVLRDRDSLASFPVAERMSWASRRQTTRTEDIAYCLMGLFNINMPILYGEGAHKAFRRLQDEIIKTSFDQTIFAWRGPYESSGLLARTPADFADTPLLGLWRPNTLKPFVMTNIGLSISLPLQGLPSAPWHTVRAALQCDVSTDQGWKILLISLRPVDGANCYVNGKRCKAVRRIYCDGVDTVSGEALEGYPYEDFMVLQDEHFELVDSTIESDGIRQFEMDIHRRTSCNDTLRIVECEKNLPKLTGRSFSATRNV